jgi:hypothetical protein
VGRGEGVALWLADGDADAEALVAGAALLDAGGGSVLSSGTASVLVAGCAFVAGRLGSWLGAVVAASSSDITPSTRRVVKAPTDATTSARGTSHQRRRLGGGISVTTVAVCLVLVGSVGNSGTEMRSVSGTE